ncbi:tRNA epoxyqueuosine(34) reductase QueG [Pelagovum pacificum]|uniref:Epoxyqueuosine reductase n=1 Tax=Pelagovum pacificum TaxID=2588711 RepID=A0A5C5GGX5_9RHOB|nr:tRNA epoxyqueuosine(34) reductase QueG [Pelagovum pacificum]QQA42913.1 tRNA epoxyqueuosine(34) reductase QueG [Pelagovum pacificum]TNY33943.1 tRNA epoxyqueuosine(34) reductase QueG [Pelagovum pacificum]
MRDEGLKEALRRYALEAGFTEMGVCRPDAAPGTAGRLAEFVAEGRHGQMRWMEERMHWRGDPTALWPEARSVVMLAESYTPEHDPLEVLEYRDRGAISVYAQGRDYHDVVKKRLKKVGRWLLEEAVKRDQSPSRHRVPLSAGSSQTPVAHAAGAMQPPEIKVFVDTAPVMEKPLAAAAGLGWQGKHTNLLGRGIGNWVFLGAIFTTIDLAPDAPGEERCGSCTRCLDICPTNAFPAPFQLDARRCISYLTIEHHGPVDEALRPGLGNRIYGCDDCLAVCPWNKFAQTATETRYAGGSEPPRLAELAALDDASFRQRFSGSPIKRIGRNRFVRNVAYAIGNSDDPALRPVAQTLTDDADETVRDAARWAALQLDKRG